LKHVQEKVGEGVGGAEVAPGCTVADLVGRLGRPPAPADVAADADAPTPHAGTLSGVFSRTSNFNRGQLLAESVRASFSLLEQTSAESGGETFAEYRLPLLADSGAWDDLTRWMSEFGVGSPRVRWVIQLPLTAYAEMKERRSVLSFRELLDNAFAPPAAAAIAGEADAEASQLQRLLKAVCGVEVAAAAGFGEELTAEDNKEPQDWISPSSPSFPYQTYYVWTRLKALNACRAKARLPAWPLVAAANTAEPLACAYMLGAKGASRCGALAAHAPLRYLFLLDEVYAAVSLASKRSLGGAGGDAAARAISQLFKAGVPVMLCTEDPAVSHQGDDPLGAEYAIARHAAGFAPADLAELGRNSRAAADWGAGRGSLAEEGAGEKTGRSVRERYRRSRREAEIALVGRLAPRAAAAATSTAGGWE